MCYNCLSGRCTALILFPCTFQPKKLIFMRCKEGEHTYSTFTLVITHIQYFCSSHRITATRKKCFDKTNILFNDIYVYIHKII